MQTSSGRREAEQFLQDHISHKKSLHEHVPLRKCLTFLNESCNDKLKKDLKMGWHTIKLNVEVSQLVNPPELLDYRHIVYS